jgi:hypothetical protein
MTTRSDDPPTYAVDAAGDNQPASNRNFELPEHYMMDLVIEIASLIGVNLRDSDVVVFTEKEQVERKTEQSF